MPSFDLLSPELQKHVKERFRNPTPIQEKTIPTILSGKNVLILASTGSGKTESSLLPIFDKIIREKPSQISTLYITPLRALNRNLQDRLYWWAGKLDLDISTRHGDTTQYERSKQAANPPDIMISTPETLQSLLVGKTMREHLKNVKYVVIDEVHELVGSKRGVQLSLALERLKNLAQRDIQIIGLSATVGSKEDVARFLIGNSDRDIEILDVSGGKKLDINVQSASITKENRTEIKELADKGSVPIQVAARLNKIWELTKNKESVLIFTNTRESAEILSSRLKILDNSIEAHHSSLSKNVRIEAERKFKEREIKKLVCTSSLELGIDIGSIDFVLQFMSPRQVSKLLQRVGRSGHDLQRISNGVIIAGEIDDVLESTSIAKLAMEKKIEQTPVYGKSLDVLAHQIVGLALEGDIELDKAYDILRKASPFEKLGRDEFFEVCMFMDKLGYLWVNDKFTPGKVFIRRKKKSWEYYYGNLSTIPDVKNYQLFDTISNQAVGSLDAEFVALNGNPGTNIICKGLCWKIIELRNDRLYVEPVGGIEAAIPAWEGELIPVPEEVAKTVADIRKNVALKIGLKEDSKKITGWLKENYPVAQEVAEDIFEIIKKQVAFGFVPDNDNILVEYGNPPEDIETDQNFRVIFHTSFGSLINDTIGRALTTALTNSMGSVGLKIDPYRIVLTLQSQNWQAVLDVFNNLKSADLDNLLEINLTNTDLFRWRFLHVAKRFGIISKGADYSKAYLRKIIDIYSKSPVYKEALNEIFEEKLDIPGAKKAVESIRKGKIKIKIMEGISPLGKLGLGRKFEIVPPDKPEKEILEMFRQRLENTEVGLVCCNCAKWSAIYTVRNLPKAIICPLCGARLVGIVPEKYADDARKLIKKNLERKKLTQQEKKWLNMTLDSGSLVITYGTDAARALAGRGVGVATAKRILSKQSKGDDLLRDILEAERQYAKNRRFWKG